MSNHYINVICITFCMYHLIWSKGPSASWFPKDLTLRFYGCKSNLSLFDFEVYNSTSNHKIKGSCINRLNDKLYSKYVSLNSYCT